MDAGGIAPAFDAALGVVFDTGTAVESSTIFGGSDGSLDAGHPLGSDATAPDAATGGADGQAGDATTPSDATLTDSAATDASTHDASTHDATPDSAGPNEGGAVDTGTPDAPTADAGACALGHLVISQVQSRGAGGGNDEFIDLYNPTASAVTLDTTWVVDARSNASASFASRWKGTSKPIPALGHYLLTGTAYPVTAATDGALSSGITDASAVRLTHAGVVVDELCYAYSTSTTTALEATGYACPGTPATNPHDDTTATNAASSLERAPGGAAGNCTDTGNSSHDFKTKNPSTPQDTSSPATP
jgi:hypothetical protein